MSLYFFLYLLAYGFSLWLGLYLLSYNFSNVGLRYAGLGLVSYACSLAIGYFQQIASSAIWVVFTLGIPAVFWTLATLHLWVQDTPPITRLHTTLPLGTTAPKILARSLQLCR